MKYVSHLADDKIPTRTACGEPWQGWQIVGIDLDPHSVILSPMEPPEQGDKIRLCRACNKIDRESYDRNKDGTS